ncbi:hypothetical protein D3C85_1279420 [compost metagenome]
MSQGLRVGAFDGGHQRSDRTVQRELDQHAGGGRHRSGHGIEEAARAPVQQGAEHDEQEVVGVQAGNRTDRRFGRELMEQPSSRQQHQQDGQQRAVFQPFTGTGAWLQRWQVEGRIDAASLGITGRVRAWCSGVGNDQRNDDQRQQHHAGLPEKDGLGEWNHPGDRQNRRRQAGRVGLQLCRGRRQAQGPHRAKSEVRRSASGAVVHFQIGPTGEGAHQQTAENQRQTPVQQ